MSRTTPLLRACLPAIAVVLFAAAPALAQDKTAPVLTHAPVTQGFKGEPLKVTATITDDSGIFAPTVHFRPVGAPSYTDVIMSVQQGSVFVAQLNAPGDLEYWIEVFDDAGNGPTRAGAEDKPFRVTLVARPPAVPDGKVAAVPAAPVPQPAVAPADVDLSLPPPAMESITAVPTDATVAEAEPLPDDALEGLDDLADAEKPFFTKWWFWTAAGGATAVATTLLVIALQPAPILQNQMGSVAVVRP